MNVKIYNYQNQYIEAPITHDVVRIDVEIITGDEIVTFYYDNGEKAHFDSGEITRRIEDIPCGQYSVTDSKEIDGWIHFVPTEYQQSWRNNFPEQRMQKFADDGKESVKEVEEKQDIESFKEWLQKYIHNPIRFMQDYFDIELSDMKSFLNISDEQASELFKTADLNLEPERNYIAISDLPDSKPVEEGNFNNEDFSKVYNRGFADGWNVLLQEIKDKAENSDEENQ